MDDELDRWAVAWRAGDPRDLSRAVRRARWGSAAGVGVVWFLAVAMVAWAGSDLVAATRWVDRVVSGGAMVFLVAMAGWLAVESRRVSAAEARVGWVAELRRRQEVEVRVGRTTLHLKLLLGFLGVWVPWKTWVDWEMYRAEPWRFLAGVGGIVLILGFVEVTRRWLLARAERRLELLRSLEEELQEHPVQG